jgi:hypothetical protein
MPLPLLLPLIGAGIGAATSGLNMASQAHENKQNRRFSESMFKWQNAENLKNWNLQNAYNDPSAQMQRLKNAGLNANMVYGGGATTTAQQIQKSSPTDYKGQAPQFDPQPAMQMVDTYYNSQAKQQNIDNLAKQNALMDADLLLKNQQLLNMQVNEAKGKWDITRQQQLQQGLLDIQAENIRKMQAGTSFTNAQNLRNEKLTGLTLSEGIQRIVKSKAEVRHLNIDSNRINQMIQNMKKDGQLKQLEINLKNKGFSWNDPYYFRAGISLADKVLGQLGLGGISPTIDNFLSDGIKVLTAKPGGWRK